MLQSIYLICLCVGGAFTVISFLFGNLFSFDFDFDFDFDLVIPLKPITILTFLVVFGGGGLVSLHYLTPWLSLIPAVVLGILFAVLIHYVVNVKLKKYETVTASEADTFMQRAEVVEKIPASSYGKISFVMNGNTISGAAKEYRPGAGIEKGKKVYIIEQRDNTYFVCEDLEIVFKPK